MTSSVPEVAQASMAVMGTSASITVIGPAASELVELARYRLGELEARWSRFDPSSEISRMNLAGGMPVVVSIDTLTLVERALEGWRVTGGAFDPTVLHALRAAGYDRTFDAPGALDVAKPGAPASVEAAGRADLVVVDRDGSTVTLPRGTGLDLGGIGKGLAGDLLAAELVDSGATGVCVEIGGDVRVLGRAADDGPWRIAAAGETLALLDGAVATSSTTVRRWRVDGAERHHLIDPRTGRNATSDVETVTVVAALGWQAEVLTTAVAVIGRRAGSALVERMGAAVRCVGTDGVVDRSPDWSALLG